MNTNFQDKKMPKEKASCNCLSIIMLNSVIKAKIILTHLDECKYEQKKIKIEHLIDDDLENVCLIMIMMIKWNLMMNLTNNLLTAKKIF